jgi:hypothetical protein
MKIKLLSNQHSISNNQKSQDGDNNNNDDTSLATENDELMDLNQENGG